MRSASASSCAAGEPNSDRRARTRLRNTCEGCSQVKPIPPCVCRASPTAACAASVAASDRGARGGQSVGPSVIDGGDRRVNQQPRGVELHVAVGEHVLDRLERADRAAELIPLLSVFDGAIQRPLPGADQLGCDDGQCARKEGTGLNDRGFGPNDCDGGGRFCDIEGRDGVSSHPWLVEVEKYRGVACEGQQEVRIHAEGNCLQGTLYPRAR